MKAGQASQTAVLVCAARAAAHGTTAGARYSDPTARLLLPPEARAAVERYRRGEVGEGARARIAHETIRRRAAMMVARTVFIDDAVRETKSEQVVILGAGLDGRAWRMEELRDAVIFEVDHPDSQRAKRERIAPLTRFAKEVRFVPVDFERDSLDQALATAGHDPSQPTTWIWEGVVMYLTPADVEATLAVVAARSTPGSRIAIAYHSPAFMLRFVGYIVKRMSEPLRSAYTDRQMRALLSRHDFAVMRDASLPQIGAQLSPEVGEATRVMKHTRIVVADIVR